MVGDKMKNAFIVTISGSYMFCLNATFNAMKHYGTNADFHVIYHEEMNKRYMERCSEAFPFKVIWHPITERDAKKTYGDLYHAFFAEKYWIADHIKDDYDAVCIIDGDLFLCANMNEYFEIAFNEKKFITATHEHSMFPVKSLYNIPTDKIVDRMYAALADFPVFFDPKHFNQFIKDWYDFTFESSPEDERNHPLIAFNRSIRKNIKLEEIVALDGNQWVCDKNYWEKKYIENFDFDSLRMYNPDRVFAIHNRWWKEGRANNEIIANRNDSPGFHTAVHNFNSIRNFMAKFNSMTPETYNDDYEKMEFK